MQNKAIVPTTSHIPLYLSTILEVLSSVLSPVLISQWFLADIVRRTTESAKCVFDYCLSPSCSTIAAKRVRSLSRIMASTNLLIPLSSAFQTPLRNLLYRTLIYRVHEGPKTQYEVLDEALERVFRDISGSSPPAQVIHAILEMVRIESWVEPGVHLYVGPFHYVRLTFTEQLQSAISSFLLSSVPTMDLDTLRAAKKVVEVKESFKDSNDLIASLDKRLSADPSGGGTIVQGLSDDMWTKIRAAVAEIIAPDEITWMEDDDMIAVDVYAERALQDIRNRFERYIKTLTFQRCRLILSQTTSQYN